MYEVQVRVEKQIITIADKLQTIRRTIQMNTHNIPMMLLVVLPLLLACSTAPPLWTQTVSFAPCSPEQYVAPKAPIDKQAISEQLEREIKLAAGVGDTQLLLTLCCRAAAAGIALAEVRLGLLSSEGKLGMTKNEVQARYWFKRAADQRDHKAELALSILYMTGRGGPVLIEEGICYLRRAAEGGIAGAQFKLAAEYVMGKNIPRGLDQATIWAERADRGGYPKAKDLLDLIRKAPPSMKGRYEMGREKFCQDCN